MIQPNLVESFQEKPRLFKYNAAARHGVVIMSRCRTSNRTRGKRRLPMSALCILPSAVADLRLKWLRYAKLQTEIFALPIRVHRRSAIARFRDLPYARHDGTGGGTAFSNDSKTPFRRRHGHGFEICYHGTAARMVPNGRGLSKSLRLRIGSVAGGRTRLTTPRAYAACANASFSK